MDNEIARFLASIAKAAEVQARQEALRPERTPSPPLEVNNKLGTYGAKEQATIAVRQPNEMPRQRQRIAKDTMESADGTSSKSLAGMQQHIMEHPPSKRNQRRSTPQEPGVLARKQRNTQEWIAEAQGWKR